MNYFKQSVLDSAAKVVQRVVKHEMAEWPPDCTGHYYQPERPVAAPKAPPEQPGK